MEWPNVIERLTGIEGWTATECSQPGAGVAHLFLSSTGRAASVYIVDDECQVCLADEVGESGTMLFNGPVAVLQEAMDG